MSAKSNEIYCYDLASGQGLQDGGSRDCLNQWNFNAKLDKLGAACRSPELNNCAGHSWQRAYRLAAHIEVKSQSSHLQEIHGSELILLNGFGCRILHLPSPTCRSTR